MTEAVYLVAQYRDRERVKALGARWDSEARSWYVPAGRDLTPFAAWLPAGVETGQGAGEGAAEPGEGAVAVQQGISLSQLMAGVVRAVATAYREPVWTRVEVVKVDVRRGHVYLELTERAPDGDAIAQARAVIWEGAANTVVPQFEAATGVVLGPGIKLLVRAKPQVHPQYGLSLVVDGIDPAFTLGDLEAKKREIRSRLKREGLFDANRSLQTPWDYTSVLVVAPQGAAGLGDFAAEADRLQHHGICTFVYAYSRFQGEGAAREIRQALIDALDSWRHGLPDAVAIIRGGGAVNDLAWLNDYDLARCICELDVPVLTGIGHERDSTVLDEVAHQSFDTPSKVILGIERVIRQRADEASAAFGSIVYEAQQQAMSSYRALDAAMAIVRTGAQRAVGQAKQQATQDIGVVRSQAQAQLRRSADSVASSWSDVRSCSQGHVADARAAVERDLSGVRLSATSAIGRARAAARADVDLVTQRAGQAVQLRTADIRRGLSEVDVLARRSIKEADGQAKALMREIAGQGPEKTLARGFAVVRGNDGRTVTSAAAATEQGSLSIQFADGLVSADVQGEVQMMRESQR